MNVPQIWTNRFKTPADVMARTDYRCMITELVMIINLTGYAVLLFQ